MAQKYFPVDDENWRHRAKALIYIDIKFPVSKAADDFA